MRRDVKWIVDCGTDHTAARPVLQRASHIIWTLPATAAGAARAHALLVSDVLPAPGHGREVLAVITRDGGSAVRVRALRAEPRCDRAVLVPRTQSPLTVDEAIAPALTALATTLREGP